MKAVNLQLLTSIRDPEKVSLLFQELSGNLLLKRISPHEAASLWTLTERITEALDSAREDSSCLREVSAEPSCLRRISTDPDSSASQKTSAEPSCPRRISTDPDSSTSRNNAANPACPKGISDRSDASGNWLRLLDGFFFSYIIEHIGKEFDLLKISSDGESVLNIELKSEDIGEERIKKQLEQNRYYLSHTSRTIFSFTYVMDTDTLYHMNERGYLRPCSFDDLVNVLKRPSLVDCLTDGIDRFFRASDYLISPVAVPEKFLQGQYFLTNQQFDFRRKILDCLQAETCPVIGISGAAGTGKTLLLFDLAMQLSRKNPILLIHSGPLRRGHLLIDERLRNVTIRSGSPAYPSGECSGNDAARSDSLACLPGEYPGNGAARSDSLACLPDERRQNAAEPSGSLPDSQEWLSAYTCLLIDEADCLLPDVLDRFLAEAAAKQIPVILTFDPHHLLSGQQEEETGASASDRISESCDLLLAFSGNIRINRPVYSFLRTLLYLKNHAGKPDYSCIDVLFSPESADLSSLISYYREKGYTPIGVSSGTIENHAADTVIAQEYSKVLMVLDDNYYYDETLHLRAGKEEEAALKLVYEGLSRTRENLCLIISGNLPLFSRILDIRLHRLPETDAFASQSDD